MDRHRGVFTLTFKQETVKLVQGRRASDPAGLLGILGSRRNVLRRWKQELWSVGAGTIVEGNGALQKGVTERTFHARGDEILLSSLSHAVHEAFPG